MTSETTLGFLLFSLSSLCRIAAYLDIEELRSAAFGLEILGEPISVREVNCDDVSFVLRRYIARKALREHFKRCIATRTAISMRNTVGKRRRSPTQPKPGNGHASTARSERSRTTTIATHWNLLA